MRVAFITPEFPTEYRDGGGLGNYLLRMCQALVSEGHAPEVFVTSSVSERLEMEGIIVHRVNRDPWAGHAQRLKRASRWLPKGAFAIHCSAGLLADAAALASAFKQQDRRQAFDLVQSADFRAVGLLIAKRRDRPHIVRCSCAADLWSAADGRHGFNQWQCRWERTAIRRADKAYAPSQLVATHYRKTYGLDVDVVRPPVCHPRVDCSDTARPFIDDGKFQLHFGQLKRRKGTDFLAAALPLVWREAPDYTMRWAGDSLPGYFESLKTRWGEQAHQIENLGPLPKSALYEVLAKAQATVLPSLVDNLPNTVIESLLFNKPVIGTFDSSIDEILADGENGWLVPYGDVDALAKAILKSWRDWGGTSRDLISRSPIWPEMQPKAAVAALLRFAFSEKALAVSTV